jgi:Flp pilus assembly protein TadB
LPGDRPKLPGGRPRAQKKGGNLGTVIGFLAVLFGSGLFVALTALVMPSALGVVIVVFGAAIFFLLHYLTWGRWLINRRRVVSDDE